MLPTPTKTNAIRSLTTLLVISSALIITLGLFVSVTRAQTSTPTTTLTTAPADGGTHITWTVSGTVSTASAPTANLTFTFDSVTGGTATSRTTSKTISEKCYIQLGKSNCSITIGWNTKTPLMQS